MEFYPWVVVAHVLLVILSFGAHGVSAFAMFAVKRETDRTRMAAVLDLSQVALVWAGVLLISAVVTGIIAAIMAGHFSRLWPWASIGVFVVAFLLMTPLAAVPMAHVRHALGIKAAAKGEMPSPGTDAELVAAQARLQPAAVAAIGVVAIALLTWMMESKPF